MNLFESPVTPLGNDGIRFFVLFVLFVAKNSSTMGPEVNVDTIICSDLVTIAPLHHDS